MKRRVEQEQSPQERLENLREELASVSRQMSDYDLLNPDRNGFVNLLRRQDELNEEIAELQESIEPEQGHGTIGQATLRNGAGVEKDRFKK
jgi:hypothetical protein